MKPLQALWVALLMLLLGACANDASNGATEAHAEHAEAGDAAEHGHPAESTVIPVAIASLSGIGVQQVRGGVIADAHALQGLLTPMDDRVAQVSARFAGVVRDVRVNVGDAVRAGQIVASIESNQSLSRYTLTAPINGVISARRAVLGAAVDDGAMLFEIADLSRLWVDLHIFGADAQHIQPGVPVTVTRLSDGLSTQTTLERVLPGMATASQSTVARAAIDNADGHWRPGAAVKARIAVAEIPVALRVPLTALQSMDGHDVVFVQEGDRYSAREVELGARDAEYAEIVSGLHEGERIVVAESYLIKADIGKSGAAHAH